MFDIDHFKNVNDTFGHNIGDYILKNLTQVVKEQLRENDFLVRWGGEEFIIITPQTEMEKAGMLAERIKKAVENYKFDIVGKLTISLGVTQFKMQDTEDTFITRTDDALYLSKRKGRNCVSMKS